MLMELIIIFFMSAVLWMVIENFQNLDEPYHF